MLKIKRCKDRFVLTGGAHQSALVHMSKRELVSLIQSGMSMLNKQGAAKACPACRST